MSSNVIPGQSELDRLVGSWRAGRGIGRYITAMEHIPARDARYGPTPEQLDDRVVQMLGRRGFSKLYSHQVEAIEHAMAGRNPVVVTPTASGKSLCYNLPVVDSMYDGHSALYLFPTKALSQDQTAELNDLMGALDGTDASWEAQVYDGDTPPDVRRRVRRNGRVVVTNPDMLHAGILPHHRKWASFFKSLRYVVVDELHTYRGVFGSHVANVLWRLRRICDHYGVEPTFVATSATIANPAKLAKNLTELNFEVVDDNGAPSAERYVCFVNPPIIDAEQMRRKSPLTVACQIAQESLKRDCGTIVFARSRRSVEILVNRLKRRLVRNRNTSHLADQVASYRGGYLPDLRRSIERGLREGRLKGVVSTNALELGIDIGSLDVCITAGYPGTIASTWQQMGRAGRGEGTTVAVVVAGDDPVDQFIINHPEYFLGRSPEAARIDAANLLIAVEHLKCAAYELEWSHGEPFGALTDEQTTEALEFLGRYMNVVQKEGSRWKWTSRTYPASEVSLRSLAEENFVVVDETGREPNVVAEVDFESAHLELYPNAVYQISGEPYRVERLDYDQRRAYVQKSDDGYYTTAMHYSSVHVLDEFKERKPARTEIGFGEVRVTQRFVGYKKIKFGTGENVGYGELNLPELDLHTMAYWIRLSAAQFEDLERGFESDPDRWARLVQGAGQVLLTAASLKMMCDPRDLDLCIGSVTHDQWFSEEYDGLQVRDTDGIAADPEAGKVAPAIYDPHVYIYDRYPGGVGIGEGLFDEHRGFMRRAVELVAGCECDDGCPSCVGPPTDGMEPVKEDVVAVLEALAG